MQARATLDERRRQSLDFHFCLLQIVLRLLPMAGKAAARSTRCAQLSLSSERADEREAR